MGMYYYLIKTAWNKKFLDRSIHMYVYIVKINIMLTLNIYIGEKL